MLTRFLLIALLVLLAARALGRLLGGVVHGISAGGGSGPPERGVRMVRDPVCGVYVVPSRALQLADRGSPVYFCSEKCRAAYRDGARRPTVS